MENDFSRVNPRLSSSSGGMCYSISAIAMIVASLLFSVIIKLAGVEEWSKAYIYLNYLCSPVALSAGIALTLKIRKISFKSIFPVKCSPKYYLIAVLLIFGLFFSLSQINEIIISLMGREPSESSKKVSEFLLNLKGGEVVAALIVIAVLPALFEETLFRGVILNTCEEGAGSVRTILILGFCFSLFHTSLDQTVYQFIAGCLFAFIAIRSRSILPGILMHFINNALVIILAVCGFYGDNGEVAISFGAHIALIVVGACSLIGGTIWLVLDKSPLKKAEKGGVKAFFVYAALGIAVLAVLWIVSLFTG